ncbi:hypothetical protein FKM82_013394 [Ascaphus truei]
MAFFVSPGQLKSLFLLLLTLLLYHGGTGVLGQADVTDVRLYNRTETTFTVQWKPLENIGNAVTRYEVELRNSSAILDRRNTSNPSYTAINLLPGVTYNITIHAVNGTFNRSEGKSLEVTTLPSRVTDFTESGRTETSVTLKWNPPNDENVATYSYTVEVLQGSSEKRNITSITGNSTVVTALLPGVNYNFTIYTVTSNQIMSSRYNDIQVTTRPSIVSDFSVTGQSINTVTLLWKTPNYTNAESYTYWITVTTNNTIVKNITTEKNANHTEVKNLQPGVNYTFIIYTGTSDNVYSSDSASTKATTRPSTVSDFGVTVQSINTVTLSWKAPHDTNAESYTYWITVTTNNTIVKNFTTEKNTIRTEVNELQPGVNYTFNIYTVTSDNVYSSDSASTKATTMPSRVTDFTESGRTETSVTLTWNLPNDENVATYSYTVEVLQGSSVKQNIPSIKGNSTVVTELSPGVSYNFTIYTVTSNRIMSSRYDDIQVTTIPNQPLNLSGKTTSSSELSISWEAPNDPNKNSYEYQVTWTNSLNVSKNLMTKNTNTSIQSLEPGNLYNVDVRSVINHVRSAVARTSLQTNPLSPESLEITNITSTNVTFKWRVPSGSGLTGIQIKAVTERGTNLEKNLTNISLSDMMYTLTGLIPGNYYNFSLRSFTTNTIKDTTGTRINRRATETGPIIITFSNGISKEEQMEPEAISHFTCSKVSGGYKLVVYLSCPAGIFTDFKVLVDGLSKSNTKNCTTVTVDNLQPGYSYLISVATVSDKKTALSSVIRCYTDDTGVIVGSIFGVLLFLLFLGVIAFFVLKRRRSKDMKTAKSSVIMKRVPDSIPVEKFPDYFQKQHADSDFGFAEEYQQLGSVGTTQAKSAAEIPDNRAKNRFTNVLPYDQSRVKLNIIEGDTTTDYINGNYMPGYNSMKEFIATQGPLPNTVADFWRMGWEHHVSTVIMLTNCMENGRLKCEHYWPLDYTPCTYENITVTVTSETILPEWTIRDFSLKHAQQPGVKYVRHFHYTVWPDHGVPENTSTIIQFRNLVREYMDERKSNGPSIVHCSAGVGRTGTLIALDYLMQQVEKEKRVGSYSFVKKMRMNRPLMVQTESQYVFLNKCMLDLIQQPVEESIYENQIGDLIYENASAIRDFQNV